jgi:hypothetical protein
MITILALKKVMFRSDGNKRKTSKTLCFIGPLDADARLAMVSSGNLADYLASVAVDVTWIA